MDRGMTDLHYIGKNKPQGWYEKEQEQYLASMKFDEEYFCWLYLEWFINEIEREREKRNDT